MRTRVAIIIIIVVVVVVVSYLHKMSTLVAIDNHQD